MLESSTCIIVAIITSQASAMRRAGVIGELSVIAPRRRIGGC
jgi:hypothetical protein